jgi:hypothetical protein
VTIFEQFGEPGGLMRTNIPSFRLPQGVLDEEIGAIVDMGVELKLGHAGREHEGAAGRGLRRRSSSAPARRRARN